MSCYIQCKTVMFVLQCYRVLLNVAAQETKSDHESTESTEGVFVCVCFLNILPFIHTTCVILYLLYCETNREPLPVIIQYSVHLQ